MTFNMARNVSDENDNIANIENEFANIILFGFIFLLQIDKSNICNPKVAGS